MSEQDCKNFLNSLYRQYIETRITQLKHSEATITKAVTEAKDAITKAMDIVNYYFV